MEKGVVSPSRDLQVLPPGDLDQQILDGIRFPALMDTHRRHPPDFEPDQTGNRSESDPPLRRLRWVHQVLVLRRKFLDLCVVRRVFPFKILQRPREFLWAPSVSRRRTNARIIATLTRMERLLFRTDDNIATPCSVKAYGRYRRPPRPFEVTNCDLKPTSPWAN